VNRWTSFGSTDPTDWLEIDFGAPKEFARVEVCIFDDRRGVHAPASLAVQYFANDEWRDVSNPVSNPAVPSGGSANSIKFAKVTAAKVRVVFTHKDKARSGVTELEVWKE
jgi:hypothetical protein